MTAQIELPELDLRVKSGVIYLYSRLIIFMSPNRGVCLLLESEPKGSSLGVE